MTTAPTSTPESTDLPPLYDPAQVEPHVLERYLASKAYAAAPDAEGDPYAIVIPPPNVTAALHLGHALNNTLQDILTRVHRMRGFNTLWMPGTDHAGIATQTVVDKRLQQEGKKALKDYKLDELEGKDGRGQFIARVTEWKDEYEQVITNQLKQMGCSCDWDRQRFTMDDQCAKAVREAFFQLFKDGLIYRGKRLVNWDPATQTALSDDEVEMETIDGNFYYMKYPLCDESGQVVKRPSGPGGSGESQDLATGPLDHSAASLETVTVATTRPETMLGDTAVAVNPGDPERAKYIGQFVKLPIVGRIIPIVGDDYVVIPDSDSEDAKAKMASGFLKVTPAHDPNDYEIGQRHDLPIINVMAPDASISIDHGWPAEENPGDNADLQSLVGLAREDARKQIVIWFKNHGLMQEVKPYRHAVGHSYRSHVPVEPYYTDQWYVKVTDDRLAGAALRAMDASQFDAGENAKTSYDAFTSRDREGADQPPSSKAHYLITFTTYGTWLHGDEKGSADRIQNIPGTPYIDESEPRERINQDQLKHDPVALDPEQRPIVRDTIQEVCAYRGWSLLACNVRSNHVHVVIASDATPEKVMNDLKSYATRRLNEAGLHTQGDKTWTRHGSTRYLNDEESLAGAIDYVLNGQGEDLGGVASTDPQGPLPHGRGSLAGGDAGRGLKFYPERYAKTFQNWHENIRDWCISRQLWWGHRIPVWTKRFESSHQFIGGGMTTEQDALHDELSDRLSSLEKCLDIEYVSTRYIWHDKPEDGFQNLWPKQGAFTAYVCVLEDVNEAPDVYQQSIVQLMERLGFTQDPDVLDTWFSSALWPLSTLGWPEQTPELETWNPTSVLCTAREIITLWVSRMVMFNNYFRGQGAKGPGGQVVEGEEGAQHSAPGPLSPSAPFLPFKHVFIHAMIQDGHGQKMSKSLGNGVDPMDIIHSHGSDAMRFTLTKMTTQTQDVRLPVDMVDPKTGETFTPKYITAKNGYKVAAPLQEHNGSKMASSYGVASGEVKPTDDLPLARNSSEKFDEGQRFANKLWNAFRFALPLLSNDGGSPCRDGVGFGLADKWILNQLAKTIETVDKALAEYRFSDYATALYDFFWRDLCDWYVEIVKPTVKDDPAQQRVLATCLDASLRLLHPAMPFITERLWEALRGATSTPGSEIERVEGIALPDHDVLIHAAWPTADASLRNAEAERDFELLRSIVEAIRNARNAYKIPPRQEVEATTQAPAAVAQLILDNRAVTQPLTRCVGRGVGPEVDKPTGAATVIVGDVTVYLHDVVDTDVEKERLEKALAEREKAVKMLEGRLSNKKYVDNAPAHLVQETRDQHAAAVKEREVVRQQLDELG